MKRIDELTNWQLKILAVFTAFLLWLFVAGSQNSVNSLKEKIPVKVLNIAEGLSLSEEIDAVNIKYKTTGEFNENLTPGDFEISVDAKGLEAGNYKLKLTAVSKNPQVRIVATEPEEVNLRLVKISSIEIKPQIKISGKPATGYVLSGTVILPEKVKINGAENILQKIKDLNLEISLDETEKADFSRILTLKVENDWNVSEEMISFEPEQLEVLVKIRKQSESESVVSGENPTVTDENSEILKKTLMVPIKLPTGSGTMIKEILPANLLVTVAGPESAINSLQGSQINVVVDLNRIERGGVFMVQSGDIEMPANSGISIIEFSPAKITVKF